MFEASRSKISRAKKHADEFLQDVREFCGTDFLDFSIDFDENTQNSTLKFKMKQHPPVELSMILGDAIHNLRAALDLAFVEFIEAVGITPTKWSTFRIWESRDKMVSTYSASLFKGFDDVTELFSDHIRNFEGGNGHLASLDALDIDDKHRLLIPTFSVVHLMNVTAELVMEGGGRIGFNNCALGVEQGGVLNLVGSPGRGVLTVKNRGTPQIAVLFGESTSLAQQAIPETLTVFAKAVEEVIAQLERFLTDRSKD
ncbi:hypothetical protein [Paraburkholderia sp. RL17-381-BIF-C]|uniref:hypothetical protein n=1 Tax=Paraburkholderia sp. RL17-381-BIF-C TaxID=3031635 RepID=UPI0038B97218